MTGSIRLTLTLGTSLAALCLTLNPAYAQAPAATQGAVGAEHDFAIPAGSLDEALKAFSHTADVQFAYSADIVANRTSPGLSGHYSVQDGLAHLLAGTGLSFHSTDARTFSLMPMSDADGERVIGAVRVEGAEGSPYFGGAGQAAGVNGTNGSRDITATEGTGSFTSGALTVGSKAPQAIKDVPQSVSVLTNERLKQQNVTDLTTAMQQMPGVTLVQGSSSLQDTFYSRGFAITSIQVDGGAPLSTNFGGSQPSGTGFYPQIDMSIYDHVELMRGAGGLFNGEGDPSGTINLVRKKPLDHSQFTLDGQVGSWSNYRLVADATAPLAFDGRLRGRLVTTYQNNHYFYDTAKNNKIIIYGIAEFDLTPTTLITAGVNYNRQDSVPWFGGLPRYENGEALGVSRSTSFALPWNSWNFNTVEIFGSIEQKIGSEWNLKLNFTNNHQTSDQKVGYPIGPVDLTTGTGPTLTGGYGHYDTTQFSAEAVLNGGFKLFGQRQEVTIGASRVNINGGGVINYPSPIQTYENPYQPYAGGPIYCQDYGAGICPSGSIPLAGPPVNVFKFNPNDPLYAEPANPLATNRYPVYDQIQTGAYLNLRLTAFDRLHLTGGVRWSRYEYKFVSEALCTNTTDSCAGLNIGDVYSTSRAAYTQNHISWPPSGSLSFDITKRLTAYVGYADIYRNQANQLDDNLKPLDPITGSNWEAGLKWAPRGGKINASLAFYKMKQKGFAELDGTFDYSTGDFIASNGRHVPNYGQVGAGNSCCFISNPDEVYSSKGVDFEIGGEVKPGLQVQLSYNYNDNKIINNIQASLNGTPLLTIQPKHLYKIWMSYDFGVMHKTGILSRLALSGGVSGQSSAYYAGTACQTAFITTDPATGVPSCAAGGYSSYKFTQPAYALVSARIDYRLSNVWSFALNLDNILDKTYYQTVGATTSSGNWYGAPRSVMATIHAKW